MNTWFYVLVPVQSREIPLTNYVFGPFNQEKAQKVSDTVGGEIVELPTRDRNEAEQILGEENG